MLTGSFIFIIALAYIFIDRINILLIVRKLKNSRGYGEEAVLKIFDDGGVDMKQGQDHAKFNLNVIYGFTVRNNFIVLYLQRTVFYTLKIDEEDKRDKVLSILNSREILEI